MSRSRTMFLARNGFLNIDAPDYSGITGMSRDPIATYCLSRSCNYNGGRLGRLVAVDKKRKCPKCGKSDFLRYDTISRTKALQMKDAV